MQIAMLLFPAEERRPPTPVQTQKKKDEAEASSFFSKN